jgi:hypothetical protein
MQTASQALPAIAMRRKKAIDRARPVPMRRLAVSGPGCEMMHKWAFCIVALQNDDKPQR